MPGQKPRKGNAPGRAVKVGEPGGRLAEELKVMQVSACAQGGKDAGRFHNMVLLRFKFYHKITIRYYVNIIIRKLSYYENNFNTPWGMGRVVVLELLWRGWLHFAVAAIGDRSHGAHFGVCKAAAAALKIEGD
jgi:hypothetical protein